MRLGLLLLVSAMTQPAGRPAPPSAVEPGPYVGPAAAPGDALVLFDGSSLAGWTATDGQPAAWTCEGRAGGSMSIVPGKGSIVSARQFQDAQIHVEFMTPDGAGGGQDRGNSGVYLQGRYEIQVLDSYKSETYPTGQCGAVYGQHPPQVNACRPPGQWQTYDIIFRAARFDAAGVKIGRARVTVLQNGVLIQDGAEISGATGAAMNAEGPTAGPLYLQEHGHAVRFRNIWVRPL